MSPLWLDREAVYFVFYLKNRNITISLVDNLNVNKSKIKPQMRNLLKKCEIRGSPSIHKIRQFYADFPANEIR